MAREQSRRSTQGRGRASSARPALAWSASERRLFAETHGDTVQAAGMIPWVSYDSPEDVCKAVQASEGFRTHFGKVAARAWNQDEPRTTMWWLIPADHTDGKLPSPACRFGKFQFAFSSNRRCIQVGLHVEKGLSAEAASRLPADMAKSQRMRSDWRWYRLVADLQSGLVASTIAEIARRQRIPLQVRVYCAPPEGLYEVVSERVVFAVQDRQLVPVGAATRTKLLPSLYRVTSGPALADALTSFPRSGRVWLDVRILSSFEVGPRADRATAKEWNGDRLWEGLLSPFSRWVK